MTYAQFLALFLCIPLVVAIVIARHVVSRGFVVLLLAVCAVAIVYTGPWDNAIIANGVWTYGRHQVSGLLVGRVPLEEYGFYVLQVCLLGISTVILLECR